MNPYNTNLFNTNNMQLEMQIHQEFLKTPEGIQAEKAFAKSKRDWWDKINNPDANKSKEDDERIAALENKLDQVLNALSQQSDKKAKNKEKD